MLGRCCRYGWWLFGWLCCFGRIVRWCIVLVFSGCCRMWSVFRIWLWIVFIMGVDGLVWFWILVVLVWEWILWWCLCLCGIFGFGGWYVCLMCEIVWENFRLIMFMLNICWFVYFVVCLLNLYVLDFGVDGWCSNGGVCVCVGGYYCVMMNGCFGCLVGLGVWWYWIVVVDGGVYLE